jgi:hypothetical protein
MTTGNYQAAVVLNSTAAGNVPLLVPVVLNIAPRLTLNESVSTVTGPPPTSTFFSLPPATKAIVRLSGENGKP